MVIEHIGHKSRRTRLAPVNYAIVDGEVYCTSGFGSVSHWYQNLLANPDVILWLPRVKQKAIAEEISDSPDRLKFMRAVLIASGFAAGAFARINARKDSDERIHEITKDYRLLHFRKSDD